jgi:alkylation response protein AidB-like acyl-CoA dehydrogenase
MDTRDTPEQAELRRAARQLVRELGPATVAELDDATRAKRLAAAVTDAGWLELRDDSGEGAALAGGVEAAIVAEALGSAVADVAFSGPLLARDLERRAGIAPSGRAVVAFVPALEDVATVRDGVTVTPLFALDVDRETERAYVVVPEGDAFRLAFAPVDARTLATDLTRALAEIPAGTPVQAVADQARLLTPADLAAWSALGLALTSADLVGIMRGVLDITVAYAGARKQYGVPVGSFQAVQHLLAEARCLMEGSLSASAFASWSVDARAPEDARQAGRIAKAYSARAARTSCETAIQVHGGIGNTWDCIVHLYLRRALLSSQWFGDDDVQLRALQDERLGVRDGLS